MGEISASTIATNRYAPEGSNRIELYNYNGCAGMTLGQLIIAVTVRRAATLERNAVDQTNLMNAGVGTVNKLAEYGNIVLQALSAEDYKVASSQDQAASDAAKIMWEKEIKPFLTILSPNTNLKDNTLATYAERMTAMDCIADQLGKQNSAIDRYAIEIETAINHRDSTYRLATQCVLSTGSSSMTSATSMRLG